MASRGTGNHHNTANACSSHNEHLQETTIPTFAANVPELKKTTSYWQIGTGSVSRVKINALRSDVTILATDEDTIRGMFSEPMEPVDIIGTAVVHIFGIPVEVKVTRSMLAAPLVADGILGHDFLFKHASTLSMNGEHRLILRNSQVIPVPPPTEIIPDYMRLLRRKMADNADALKRGPWSVVSQKLRDLESYLPYQVTRDDRLSVVETLDEYADCFHVPGERLDATTLLKYAIRTRDTGVIATEQRHLPREQWNEIEREVENLLRLGVIRPSTSQHNSPVSLTEKKPNSKGLVNFRLAVDFRELNSRCQGDAFPIPDIVELVDQLHGARIFTVLDLASASYQIPLEPSDRRLTAFTTRSGHYEFLRTPAGIKNASQNVQRLMCEALNPVYNCHGVFVCHDDILIHAATPAEHEIRVRRVLGLLRDAGLKLQPDKCQLFRSTVLYLGHVISEEGLRANTDKVRKARMYSQPETATSLRRYLGLLNFFSRFIPNYAARSKPMTNLLKGNDESLTWTREAMASYDDLRKELTRDWLLRYPDWTREFILDTSSSALGIHVALKQRQKGDDEPAPIAYASRCFTPAEAKESACNRHRLAATYAMETFYWYFSGEYERKKFTLRTPEPKAFEWFRKREWHNCEIKGMFELTYSSDRRFSVERLPAVN